MPARKSCGFTLLELLIVIFILGIIIGFVVVSTGNFDKSYQLNLMAHELKNRLMLAREEAILRPHYIAFRPTSEGYGFYFWNMENTSWQTLPDKSSLLSNYFKKNIEINFKDLQQSEIVFTPEGWSSAFHLMLRHRAVPGYYELTNQNKQITLNHVT